MRSKYLYNLKLTLYIIIYNKYTIYDTIVNNIMKY